MPKATFRVLAVNAQGQVTIQDTGGAQAVGANRHGADVGSAPMATITSAEGDLDFWRAHQGRMVTASFSTEEASPEVQSQSAPSTTSPRRPLSPARAGAGPTPVAGTPGQPVQPGEGVPPTGATPSPQNQPGGQAATGATPVNQ